MGTIIRYSEPAHYHSLSSHTEHTQAGAALIAFGMYGSYS